jgi:shikimate kinase
MNIILIGFRGTGKTTLGKILAERLNRTFIDTDALVIEKAGQSIPEIFSQWGEKEFREREKEIIQNIQTKHAVIACGGGAVMEVDNVSSLKRNGFIIFLTASSSTIYDRIKENQNRPPLTNLPLKEEIEWLLEQRGHLYFQSSDMQFSTEHSSIETLASRLLAKLSENDVACYKN